MLLSQIIDETIVQCDLFAVLSYVLEFWAIVEEFRDYTYYDLLYKTAPAPYLVARYEEIGGIINNNPWVFYLLI